MKRALALLAVLMFGVLFGSLVADYRERQTLSPLAQHYLDSGACSSSVRQTS